MGWLLLLAIGAGTMALLVALGVPRTLWSFVGAALMLGAAGYAWQGSPAEPGRGPDPRAASRPDDPEIVALRDEMLGRFTLDGAYLVASDAMAASGNDAAAVRALLGGLNRLPNSFALWTALGTAYARHDGGQMAPAARFAFARARRLAPDNPAPPFFEGLGYIRAGDFAAARPKWLTALRLAPPGRAYRREIALRVALLDRALEMQAAQPGPR